MSTEKERDKLYTVPNASRLTNVPRRTLYYAIEQKFLKSVDIDGKPFVTLEAIEQWKNDPRYHKPGPK